MEQGRFEEEIHEALKHLYEPATLRKSLLVGWFNLQDSRNPASALRTLLEKEIETLKPDEGSPHPPRSARSYQILYYRYVQGFIQRDVAHQLGISARHLRREQATAVEELAERLRRRFDVPSDANLEQRTGDRNTEGDEEMRREMSWLSDSLADEVSNVAPVMEEARDLANPLALEHNVALRLSLEEEISPVAVAGTVLKQIVLNLTTTAICSVPGGTVHLTCKERGREVVIRVRGEVGPSGTWQQLEGERLDMARRLIEIFDGRLSCAYEQDALAFEAILPSAKQTVVLAVEDNVDTLQLWERYLRGTRFHFVGVPDPTKALEETLAQEPDLIVLDVMMPEVDGWELLGQLHNHPSTSTIPIIVCTVLPQEELALSLGASDFIRKPATRRSFRAVLQRQSEALAPA